jgi:hypothetical protein
MVIEQALVAKFVRLETTGEMTIAVKRLKPARRYGRVSKRNSYVTREYRVKPSETSSERNAYDVAVMAYCAAQYYGKARFVRAKLAHDAWVYVSADNAELGEDA